MLTPNTLCHYGDQYNCIGTDNNTHRIIADTYRVVPTYRETLPAAAAESRSSSATSKCGCFSFSGYKYMVMHTSQVQQQCSKHCGFSWMCKIQIKNISSNITNNSNNQHTPAKTDVTAILSPKSTFLLLSNINIRSILIREINNTIDIACSYVHTLRDLTATKLQRVK